MTGATPTLPVPASGAINFPARGKERFLDRTSLAVLAAYWAVSLLIFRGALPFSNAYVGIGPDPSLSMWFLAWWPYSVVHHVAPFYTDVIWVPEGVNLSWTTFIPLPGLVMLPVTAILGPILSFNLLCFAGPALCAWSAFLLCRYLCRSSCAALLGGYLFGFSAYILQKQICGQLDLTLVFLLPMAVLLVTRTIAGEMTLGRFVAWMATLLVAQFLICVEVFATMTVLGVMSLLLALLLVPEARRRVTRMFPPLCAAYVIAAIVVSPYLYSMFADGVPSGAFWTPESFSADLWNFVVPSSTTELGVLPILARLSEKIGSGACEANAYIGLPLILVTSSYAWMHWRRDTVGKFLVDLLIIVCVLAMGPIIHAGGAAVMQGPGKVLTRMPLLQRVLPARLMVYAFLTLAIIASLWLVDRQLSIVVKIATCVLVSISIIPNLSSTQWVSAIDTPEFFSSNLYRHHLKANANILVVPYGVRGNSMLWQAQTGMYFKMVGGYSGPTIPEYKKWLIVNAFTNPSYVPNGRAQLLAFMAHHDVSTMVVGDNGPDSEAWQALASSCCVATAKVGGVTLYRAEPKELASYASSDALQLEQEADMVLFVALVRAADRLLANGNSMAVLTPRQAQLQGLLPASWLIGPTGGGFAIVDNQVDPSDERYRCGAWLGSMEQGRIGVGVYGSYASLEPIIERFGLGSAQVYFPYPRELRFPYRRHAEDSAQMRGLMVVEFDRAHLEAAVRQSEIGR